MHLSSAHFDTSFVRYDAVWRIYGHLMSLGQISKVAKAPIHQNSSRESAQASHTDKIKTKDTSLFCLLNDKVEPVSLNTPRYPTVLPTATSDKDQKSTYPVQDKSFLQHSTRNKKLAFVYRHGTDISPDRKQ